MSQPIPMILFCPACGLQHIDAPEPEGGWDNPPHKSHLCHGCGHIWRPADVATNGVAEISTRGDHDSTRQRFVAARAYLAPTVAAPLSLVLEDGTVWPNPYVDPRELDEPQATHHVNAVLGAYGHLAAHPAGVESCIGSLRNLRRAVRAWRAP